jgi:hypothetical protein
VQPDTRATKFSCDRPPVEGGILTETGRRIRCGHVMSTNPPQGHSNLALTTVCGGIHQNAALTPACQQPQYSGLLNSVNTKCSMSATSSKKPVFVQVFRKILKLTTDRDSRRRRIFGIVVAAAAANEPRQRGSISGSISAPAPRGRKPLLHRGKQGPTIVAIGLRSLVRQT